MFACDQANVRTCFVRLIKEDIFCWSSGISDITDMIQNNILTVATSRLVMCQQWCLNFMCILWALVNLYLPHVAASSNNGPSPTIRRGVFILYLHRIKIIKRGMAFILPHPTHWQAHDTYSRNHHISCPFVCLSLSLCYFLVLLIIFVSSCCFLSRNSSNRDNGLDGMAPLAFM